MEHVGGEVLREFDELDTLVSGMKKLVLGILFGELYAVQLTDGCEGRCDFCCVDSKGGIDAAFSFSFLEQLANDFGEVFKKRNTVLFHASDPLDYVGENGQDYGDLHQMWMDICEYSPLIVTRLPEGKEYLLDKLPGGQISQSILNFWRINQFEEQIDRDRWLIKPINIIPMGRAARNYAREGVSYVFRLDGMDWCSGYVLSPEGLSYVQSYGLPAMPLGLNEIERKIPWLYHRMISEARKMCVKF